MKDKYPIYFLKDIENSLLKIFRYTDDIDFDRFMTNDMLKDAIERNFEIIGEAVKKLPAEFREKYPHIPFRQVAGMRDKLIHDYFGIDYQIIWKTIKDKLPTFYSNIKDIIDDNKEN